MPQTIFSSLVNASLETVWNLLLDKVENPGRYISEVKESKILERYDNGVLREMRTPKMTVKERITLDEQAKEIRFTLVDSPLFSGDTINRVIPPSKNHPDDPPILTFTLNWEPSNEEAQKISPEEVAQTIQHAVLETKSIAEQQETQKRTSTKQETLKSERLPGERTEILKRMFEASESMNIENFVKFYTDDALFQFSIFPIVYGPQGIRDSSVEFFKKVKGVYHDLKAMWEFGDTVAVEMEVTYTRHDGKVFMLPCCDTVRMKGDLIQEMRIYMDITPVFC